ncbi:hypothetical protein LUW76_12800 [Actinomadura madurae]|uniref:hypothetical protein n=1 Tax=Actinomadura madurae TaxID=1993 RepID=UPI00202719C3|nr:hypothetical protein [Actinomadura madurae]URM95120.1 hypothetical protein LUW76_12800 [Actinomadura madurae]
MRVLLFFNELSCSVALPKDRIDEAMKQFVGVLRKIAAQRNDTFLISDVKLPELELAPGYYLSEWSGRPANVDLWRRIRGMQNRAPFSSVLPPGVGEGADYSCGGRAAKALGAAHLLDGALVSLLVDSAWDAPWIRADRSILTEGPSGEPVVIGDSVEVRHASTLDHAETHLEWVRLTGIPDLKHGSEIWEARGDLYPHLLFLPRTEEQLHGLDAGWVVPAAQELRRIDDAIGDWNPTRAKFPTWRSHITPEATRRKRLCEFEDFDGTTRVFDLHGRFTPGAGRVHFRLVPETGTATIAYIGRKLGA